jgi:beta-galactosidase
MSPTNDGSGSLLSRRDLLSRVAGGAVLVSASPYLAQAQALLSPDSSATRTRESFDFGWKFLKADAPGAQRPQFADASWRDLDLPHDWSIEGPFDEKAPSSGPGAYLPTGIGWYRKRFRVAESARDKVTLIEFDGVYQNSEVWINGQYLGLRPYGYIPFYYELTPHLNFGGENVLAVRVDNSRQTNCRWYSGSGIDRHTWLLTTNPLRVAYWGTFVTTPRVSQQAAMVQVKTRIANSQKDSAQCTLTTAILDRDGNTVQTADASQEVEANGEYEFVQQFVVDKPSLWSPANPYMYKVRSTLHQASQVVDSYDTPFGVREAIFDADRGFLLNGEHLKLNGACIHQEAGSVGSAVPEAVWVRRLNILHEMGCNAIRTSHNPYPAEFLDLCDKMGFLVMNEAFDEWKVGKGQIKYGYSIYFDEWHERDAKNFLHRDRNHPSVVLWSAGNEIPDQDVPAGVDTLRNLLEIFHAEDPTRLVTAACDHIAADPPVGGRVLPEFLALLDVVGYNYVDRWRDRAQKYYSIDHDEFPERRVIGTESGAMGGVRGDYRSLVGDSMPEVPARFQFVPGRDVDVEQLWKFVGTYDYVAGDFMWTGIDYLGEAFWPSKGSASGVIDTCGFKKDGFYFYQSQWTDAPMVHLFPHWTWTGKEGQSIPVTCYTNCDTVELFVNGKSLGVRGYEFPRYGMEGKWGNLPARAKTARTTGDLHLTWDVPYEPGTLKAVGTKDGNIAATMEISTAGEPAAINLSVDRTKIAADRRDVAHVKVEIRDAQGRVVPNAASEITFDVQGQGKILGVDNGDPQSHEDYKSNLRKAFNGLCLLIVQSTVTAGQIKITASSPGLQSSDVTIASGS